VRARTYGVCMALVLPMQLAVCEPAARAAFPNSPAHFSRTLSNPKDLGNGVKIRASVFQLDNLRLHHRLAEAKWASCGHPWWPSR
jgi:hypothetical protein